MATNYDRHSTGAGAHIGGQIGGGLASGNIRFDGSTDKHPYSYYQNQNQNQYQFQGQGPSASKILALITLLPLGAILLGLSGITFVATLIGLAIATPVFLIFSPVLVPAVLTIALAVTGFFASGTFGLTGLSSLSYMVNMLRSASASISVDGEIDYGKGIDYAKGKVSDLGMYAGQKAKEMGQNIQHKAHDLGDSQGQGGGRIGVHAHVGAGAGGGAGGGGKEGGKGGDRA